MFAGIYKAGNRYLTWSCTKHERIPYEIGKADTIGRMTNNATFCISSTNAWARIFTSLINASQMVWTFAIANAFRAAVWWRANIIF